MKVTNGKKVFVGLSGGVDSSVSAALLKDQGYDVTGVFIKVWHPDFLPCNWIEERRDAMRVCAKLGIPFLTFNFKKEYKQHVVDYMISEYKSGRTPNPDVMCNKYVKFGSFLNKALEMGADYVATGHYARNVKREAQNVKSKEIRTNTFSSASRFTLHAGLDFNKDQSYFLWTLTQKELSHTLFPVGHLEKSEVRKIAKKYRLHTAEKKDSQGLCFMGKVDMKEFLQHYIKEKPGKILDESGEVIGTHDGAMFYTMGQRHGFTVTKKNPTDSPYYVIAKSVEKNTITVSHKFEKNNELKNMSSVHLENINWILDIPSIDKIYYARIRYRQEIQKCKVQVENVVTKVFFEKPQGGVSRGQSLVLYDRDVCLGGGIIKHAN